MAFVKAKREKVWLKILLSGASGSGKSYSALILADAIAKQCGSRVAYIGTEGSRDKYYSDEFDYDLNQIEDPYTTDKYMTAIQEAVDAGYKVLVIDSMSHEWKWLNDTHDKMQGNSFTNWGRLKPRHNLFMDKVLTSPIHIIATSRSKTDWLIEERDGKKVPKKVGTTQIQDKEISYDYTVSLLLDQDTHVASTDKDNTHLFDGRYDVITAADGVKLWQWANSGEAPAPMPKEKPQEEVFPEDELKSIKHDIIEMCKNLGGTQNENLMTVLKTYTPSGNPNVIKSIEKARECLEAISKLA